MQDTASTNPPQGAGQPPTPEPAPSPVKEMLKKWLLYRVPALLAWLWLLLRFFEWKIPIEQRIESYLIFPSIVALVILVFTRQWANTFGYPFYLLFSPTLLVFLPIGIVIKLVSNNTEGASVWVKSLGSFLTFIRSIRFIVLQIFIVIAAWIVVARYAPAEYKPGLALAAHIVGYLLFLQSFRWAANPYRPILFVLRLASKIFVAILEKLFIEVNLKKKRAERNDGILTCETIKGGLKKLHDPTSEMIHGITSVTHGHLSAIFTFVFFSMYFGIAASFGSALYEMELGWGKVISGLGDAPGRMAYFYFSFLSQATAIPDGVKPETLYGQIWIIWLVTTGLLSLTGLITLFTSSAGVYSESSLKEIDTVFGDLESKLIGWRSQLLHHPDPEA